MRHLLRRLNFVYKKTKAVPGKTHAKLQRAYLAMLEKVLVEKGEQLERVIPHFLRSRSVIDSRLIDLTSSVAHSGRERRSCDQRNRKPIGVGYIQKTIAPDWSTWCLEKVNHVQSAKSITISDGATCLYDGKLTVPRQLEEVHYGYEIINGCATEANVRIESATTQARVSGMGVFSTSPVNADITNISTASVAPSKCIIM